MFMRRNGFFTILTLTLFWVSVAFSQEHRTEIRVYFHTNSTTIDSAYMDNDARLQEMMTFLQNIQQDSMVRITEISICGASSPEGSYEHNRKLAWERLSSLESMIRQQVDLPDSIVTRNDSYISWNELKTQIRQSDLQGKEDAIGIIEEEPKLVGYSSQGSHIDNRIVKLRQLYDGEVWQQISNRFFSHMRNAYAIIVTYKEELPPIQEPAIIPESETELELLPNPELAPKPVQVAEPVVPVEEGWNRQLHLKTNALGWALLITNLAAEVDLAEHWSFTLPIYFSGWDYFTSTIKFRTFAIQPEFRYWFSEENHCNDGWFVGAHFGLAYYDLAIDGDYRYQDHNRHSPAIGGGVSGGYRMPISKNKRWRVEFTLGAGAYSLHYDKFYNTPRTKDGKMAESKKEKTYWGIDQAAVTFSYSFDLKKKGGK